MPDGAGLAQLARAVWFTPVHIRSEEADRLRALVRARERLIRLRKDLEGNIRGVLKTFVIRLTGVAQGQQRQAFRDQLAAAGETDPVLRAIAAHAALWRGGARYHRDGKGHRPLCREPRPFRCDCTPSVIR